MYCSSSIISCGCRSSAPDSSVREKKIGPHQPKKNAASSVHLLLASHAPAREQGDRPRCWPPRRRFLARSPCFAIALGEPLFSYLSCAPPPHIASTSLPQLPAVALRTSRVSFPAFMHWRSFVPLDCFAFASNQLLRWLYSCILLFFFYCFSSHHLYCQLTSLPLIHVPFTGGPRARPSLRVSSSPWPLLCACYVYDSRLQPGAYFIFFPFRSRLPSSLYL